MTDYKTMYECLCTYTRALTEDYNKLLSEIRYNENHDEKGRFCSANITIVGQMSNTQSIENEFGNLKSHEIIITRERAEHIKTNHPNDYYYFKKYGNKAVSNPDIIIKDCKNDNTVFMIKKLKKTYLNVVVKLKLDSEKSDHSNSVITSYRIRDRNLKKLQNKNKILYKSE